MERAKETLKQPGSFEQISQVHNTPSAYLEHFPRRLEFYSFGVVETTARSCPSEELLTAAFTVAFQIGGEEAGLCLVGFEPGPGQNEDARSMAVELSNILASKFITQLADATQDQIMISPPQIIENGTQLYRYVTATLSSPNNLWGCTRKYEYSGSGFEQERLQLRMCWLPTTRGGLT